MDKIGGIFSEGFCKVTRLKAATFSFSYKLFISMKMNFHTVKLRTWAIFKEREKQGGNRKKAQNCSNF